MKPSKYPAPRNNGDDRLAWRITVVAAFALFAAAVVLWTLAGCRVSNPRAELLTSQKIFVATVNVLTELKAAGQLGDDEIEDIGALIHLGEKYLIEWQQAIKDGVPNPGASAAFSTLLAELVKIRSNHDSLGTSNDPAPRGSGGARYHKPDPAAQEWRADRSHRCAA